MAGAEEGRKPYCDANELIGDSKQGPLCLKH